MPACKRSGWYPQPKMSKRVGISEASNIKQKESALDKENVTTRTRFKRRTNKQNPPGLFSLNLTEFCLAINIIREIHRVKEIRAADSLSPKNLPEVRQKVQKGL